jgi:hypothetical protein
VPRKSLWVVIASLNAALIAHLLVYAIGDFPEFNRATLIKLWISIAAGAGFTVFAAWQMRARTPFVPAGSAHTPFAVGAAAFLLILGVIPVPPYPFPNLAHAHALLTFVVTLLAIYRALFEDEPVVRHPRWWMMAAGSFALIVTLVRLYGLSYYPFVDLQDEAWVTAWTVNWLQTGHFGDPTLFGLGDAYYAYPRFYWLLGGWIRLFGIGLWQERVFGFLLIFPVIGFSAAAARNLYGMRAALLTAAALFASAVLMSAARVRHDIGLAICLAASLWLFTEAVKHRSDWRHFAAGLVIGLGMFSHYHAAGFGVALLIGLYVPRLVQRRRIERGAILYGIGGAVGFLIVLIVQMLPDDIGGWLYIITRISKYSDDTNQFAVAFVGNFISIGFFSLFELLLLALGVVAAVRRRRERDVSLLLVLISGHVLLAIMASGAIYYYILPLAPIYGMLIGALFVRPDDDRADLPYKRGDLVAFALLLMPVLGATTTRPLQAVLNGDSILAPTPPAVQWVLDNVPADQSVAGDLYYYFWLHDHPFASHLIHEYLYPENEARYPTIDAVWEAAAPAYIIIDPAYDRSYRKYFTPLMATDWLNAHYTIAQDFDDTLSTAVIYRRKEDLRP